MSDSHEMKISQKTIQDLSYIRGVIEKMPAYMNGSLESSFHAVSKTPRRLNNDKIKEPIK